MEFITAELKTQVGLTDEQIQALTPAYNDSLSNLKKGWDSKANENAEGIINGVISSTQKAFGVQLERQQGERHADYLTRLNENILTGSKSQIETLKAEYETKLKDFKGDDATKEELLKVKTDLDNAKKLYADYDTLKEKAEKFEPLQSEYNNMRLNVAYQSVKPSFPQEVNQYEASAKWNEFVKSTNEKFDIQIIEGEAIAIDKENEHKRFKLSELVKQNKEVSELLVGRQQTGTGARATGKAIQGLDFELSENADLTEISIAITEHLSKKGIQKGSLKFPSEFEKLHKLVKEKKG